MTSKPSPASRTFTTPLAGGDLLDSGQEFPRDEIVRRVLSLFWRNCCGVPGLARAPAPVLEFSTEPKGGDVSRMRVRAWWILYDGIVEEGEGPHAERLALFFGGSGETSQLWPRYEFELMEKPFSLKLGFHLHAGVHRTSRIILEDLPDRLVRVTGREFAAES
jgi:hypothetical protein